MPNSNLDILQKANISPACRIWTLALEKNGVLQTCYLTHLRQIDDERFVGLVDDYSVLASQIRMSAELGFLAPSVDGREIEGLCSVKVCGRLDDLKGDQQELETVVDELRSVQYFSSENLLLIEVALLTSRLANTLPSRPITPRT